MRTRPQGWHECLYTRGLGSHSVPPDEVTVRIQQSETRKRDPIELGPLSTLILEPPSYSTVR